MGIKAELHTLEFENDGRIDLLTGVMAPKPFMDGLAREMEIGRRETRSLSILSVRAKLENFSELSLLEAAIQSTAKNLLSQLRTGDLLTRISDIGFWLMLRTSAGGAASASARLTEGVVMADWRVEVISSERHELLHGLIQRLDSIHFK